jgi:5-methyltetrahydrofolate--homocysteine methyltransferase
MERRGMTIPLLVGGATTSRAHTAIKIAPHYSSPVIHILDASRAVPVTTSLLSEDGKAEFVARHAAEYEALRTAYATPQQVALPLAEARARRSPIMWRSEDLATPEFTGVRVLENVPLEELRHFIDWSPFFHAWGLKGIYPRILESDVYGAQATQIFAEGNALLDRIVAEKLLTARGVYGLFPANAVGDDIVLNAKTASTDGKVRFHFLRQQVGRGAIEPCRSLADFIAPHETGLQDSIGAFAVTSGIGLHELRESFRAHNDDYNAIMAEALADRLAEAFAEWLHKQVRDAWGYGRSETLTQEEMLSEQYRGIRPAPGYPACPDHTEKATIWRLLDVQQHTGITLTESFAMWPGSSISGLYFAHPEARYFSVGKIGRDQLDDYAARKGMSIAEAERWLSPNLNYDPEQ